MLASPCLDAMAGKTSLMVELWIMPDDALIRCPADAEAISHLRLALSIGKHWYISLLEAISLWGSAEEDLGERHFKYLIGGEAFDWLVLAERLCLEIGDMVPEQEKLDLLFYAVPPLDISRDEFGDLIGPVKYKAHLNFVYGVLVEEVLTVAVEEEVLRERRSFVAARHQDEYAQAEAYRRVYGEEIGPLLDRFRTEAGYALKDSTTMTELKEFRYWLFKYRVEKCDKERVASDTRKALDWFQRQWASRSRKMPSTTLLPVNAVRQV